MKIVRLILSLLLSNLFLVTPASEIAWHTLELINKGRIDAIAHLGIGVIVIGSRNTNPALLFRSTDYGITWKKIGELESTEKRVGVTCIESGGDGICYLLNESSEFFRSLDYGDTWQRMTKLSNGANDQGFALSYGICVTKKGTILVSDSNSSGGSIYRSTDNGITFSKMGFVSTKGLYRFTLLEKTIIVNGWEGFVYVSKDDGLSWERLAVADKSPLYATETIGGKEYLQGTESGNIFLGNESARSIKFIGKPGGAADDFVYVGSGIIIYSTYTESRSVFISYDRGKTWLDDGIIPTQKNQDWLDHIIRVEKRDSIVILGGTNKGSIVRTSFSKNYLKHLQKEFSQKK